MSEQPGGACGQVLLEALGRAARSGPAVVVAGEHDGGLVAAGQVPEARDRRPRRLGDQVGEQALLLVRGGDRRPGEVEPREAARGVAEEHVVGADESDRVAVALLARPRGVALPRVDDRAREVVGEGRGVAAADAAQRHRRRAGAEGGHRRGARQRVAVGGTVVLQRGGRDARPGRSGGVDAQVGVIAGGTPEGRDPEKARKPRVGAHGDQVAARVDPVGEHRRLCIAQRRAREHDHVVAAQQRGRQAVHRRGREVVQALAAHDLRDVVPELVGAARCDDQDRSARRGGDRGARRGGHHGQAAGEQDQCGTDRASGCHSGSSSLRTAQPPRLCPYRPNPRPAREILGQARGPAFRLGRCSTGDSGAA